MASELEALQAQVAANSSVIHSALDLIQGISARISAAGVDPNALSSLITSLNTDDQALAAAVVANTPAANLPPGTPPVDVAQPTLVVAPGTDVPPAA